MSGVRGAREVAVGGKTQHFDPAHLQPAAQTGGQKGALNFDWVVVGGRLVGGSVYSLPPISAGKQTQLGLTLIEEHVGGGLCDMCANIRRKTK